MTDNAGPRGTGFGPSSHRVVLAGDSMLVVELEERVDPDINARAIAMAGAIEDAALAGVRDVVPTYRTVAIHFDPLRTAFDALSALIDRVAASTPAVPGTSALIEVPVCYGGELGPDLEAVAARAGLTPDEVVDVHQSTTYRVYMLGFVPGFAYMGTVPPRIQAPRHPTPRLRVPAGSVGIAGFQTGIYPAETPGGWQLLGRTPLVPFDARRATPSLFKPGDQVRFRAIGRVDFERLTIGA